MTKQELTKFKTLLLKKKEALLKDIGHSKDTLAKSQRDATGELSGSTFHMADVATDNYDREFGLSIASNEQRVIWEIDEAIGRINDRTFGNCQSCGKKISKNRLTAVPYAKFCLGCQNSEEQNKRKEQSKRKE